MLRLIVATKHLKGIMLRLIAATKHLKGVMKDLKGATKQLKGVMEDLKGTTKDLKGAMKRLKYTELQGLRDILNLFSEIANPTKAEKVEIYQLLVMEFRYFE
jgi:hypothetical protein